MRFATRALQPLTRGIGQLLVTLKLCLEGNLHESAVRTGIII